MAAVVTKIGERTWRWESPGARYVCDATILEDSISLYEGPDSSPARDHEGGGNTYARAGFPGNVHPGWKKRYPELFEVLVAELAGSG